MKRKYRNHTAAFKAKVAIEAAKEEKAEIEEQPAVQQEPNANDPSRYVTPKDFELLKVIGVRKRLGCNCWTSSP